MPGNPKIHAYFYPGWTRNRSFDEWDIVDSARPRFEGHLQPRRPLKRYYVEDEDSMIQAAEIAYQYGIDGFVFLLYWSKGRIEADQPIQHFKKISSRFPKLSFSICWVNRKPHGDLPLPPGSQQTPYEPNKSRLVSTDLKDYQALLNHLDTEYFHLDSYERYAGKPTLQIYDVRRFLSHFRTSEQEHTLNEISVPVSLIATVPDHIVDPWFSNLPSAFELTTSYVLLPDFSGPTIQDYGTCCARAKKHWDTVHLTTSRPNIPSVSAGWDASPRSSILGSINAFPNRTYPHSPIVVNNTPERFRRHLLNALRTAKCHGLQRVFISSFNEWSEGHFIEPCSTHGHGFLNSVLSAKNTLAAEVNYE